MKKVRNFKKEIISLTKFHYSRSIEYKKIMDFLYTKKINKLEDVPFLPINLFKDLNLKSISESEVFKILIAKDISVIGFFLFLIQLKKYFNSSCKLSFCLIVGEKFFPT